MIFDDYPKEDILRSLVAECAKALAEIRCAKKDLDSAESRLKFLLSAIHYIKDKEI